jgi:hypothetical protein
VLPVAAGVLVAAAVLSAGALAGLRSAACTAGVHTVAGATVRSFCGPARGTAKAAGTTFSFSGGQCSLAGGYFTVNIGSITLPPAKPKFSYLGIDVKPPQAGTHPNQIVTWQAPGRGYSVNGATVTITAGMKGGSFTGQLLTGGTASGSFTC